MYPLFCTEKQMDREKAETRWDNVMLAVVKNRVLLVEYCCYKMKQGDYYGN